MENIRIHDFDNFLKSFEEFLQVAREMRDIQNQQLDEARRVRELLEVLVVEVSPPPPPTGFTVTEEAIQSPSTSASLTEEEPEAYIDFSKPKGETLMIDEVRKLSGVDLQILPNGKVRFTLSLVPATAVLAPGTPPIQAVSSAPLSLGVAPDPADTTGLVFLGTPVLPAVPATGIVVTFSDTLLPAQGGSTISQAADPVDVVADPTQPTGFAVVESVA